MVGQTKPVHEWTILIIDDNIEVADSLRQLLILNGVTALLATTGQEGLDLLKEIEPTLVLLDSVMPDMSGEDVLRIIHQRFPDADFPVVAFTATAQLDANAAADAGYDGYINKPFVVDKLMEDLRQILQRNHQDALR